MAMPPRSNGASTELPSWLRLEQRLEGLVVLEHGAPRAEDLEHAMERAGYRRVDEPAPADVVSYRDAATPSLSMTFVARGARANNAVKRIHVFRADARTMGYAIACKPLWLLQVWGVVIGVGSVLAAAFGDPRHRPWVAGLIAAGIFLGLPKLWIDDARQVLREAIEGAVSGATEPGTDGRVRVAGVSSAQPRTRVDLDDGDGEDGVESPDRAEARRERKD